MKNFAEKYSAKVTIMRLSASLKPPISPRKSKIYVELLELIILVESYLIVISTITSSF